MSVQKKYSSQDHHVWELMHQRQMERVRSSQHISEMILEGFDRIQLPENKIPDFHEAQSKLQQLVGWKLANAENEYLSGDVWFQHLLRKEFPVTNYIRPMKDIDFTPLPDLFHEYFGHMPQMACSEIADLEWRFADVFWKIPKEHRMKLYTLSWYSIEYGFLLEKGKEVVFGAGLLSSPGDLSRSILPKSQRDFIIEQASLENILKTNPSPHIPHQKFFLFDSFDHINQLLNEFEACYSVGKTS